MKIVIYTLFLLFVFTNGRGQFIDIKHVSRDTAYVKDFYTNHFILRVFECTKYNNFKLMDKGEKLVYKQNQHNDIGFGFNYKILFLNIELSMPFTERDRDIYGSTRSFDVQTYFYFKKYIFDIYTQFYQGYYLGNAGDAISGGQPRQVIIRPDIKTADLGLNVTYVFNDNRFSFNAPFIQNEVQLKSAGSVLAGGGAYFSNGTADSSFIPAGMKNKDFYQGRHFNKFSYVSVAGNVGYAYTQVIRKRFFVTGALTGGPGIGYSVLHYNQPEEKGGRFGISYSVSAKFAAGWSSDRYFVGATYIRLLTVNNTVWAGTREEGNTGNFQFTVAKRFLLKKTLIPKSRLIKID